MTALEVGAHTFNLANEVGENGRVIAFGPMGWARKKRLRNLTLNHLENVVIEGIALSDHSGEHEVRFRSNWPLDSKHQPEANIVELVRFETLDSYVENNSLSINLIKLNVDGYEERVLQGSLETISCFRPVIIMEVDIKGADRLTDLLTSMGYRAHNLSDGEVLTDVNLLFRTMSRGYSSLNLALIPE